MNSIVSLFRMATRFAVIPVALVVPFAPLLAFTQSQGQMPGFLSLPDPSRARADSPGELQNQLGLAPIAIADRRFFSSCRGQIGIVSTLSPALV